MGERRGWRVFGAGALSVALHLAVLAALVRLAAAPPPPPEPVVVELRERVGPPAAALQAAGPTPAATPPGGAAASPAARMAPIAAPPASAAAPASEPTPTLPPAAWFGSHGLAAARAPDLSTPSPAPSGGSPGPRGRLSPGAGPLAPLGEGLASGFAPGWDLLASLATALPAQVFEGAAAHGYLATARRYADTGSPFGRDPGAPGAADDNVSATARAALAPAYIGEAAEGLMAVQSGLLRGGPPPDPPRRLTTVVAVTQDADGTVASVAVEQPSGSVVHDRLALAQAERLRGRVLPAPPGGGVTTWAFESDLGGVPSWVFDCALTALVRHQPCPAPLHRLAGARVTLVTVRPGRPAPGGPRPP